MHARAILAQVAALVLVTMVIRMKLFVAALVATVAHGAKVFSSSRSSNVEDFKILPKQMLQSIRFILIPLIPVLNADEVRVLSLSICRSVFPQCGRLLV